MLFQDTYGLKLRGSKCILMAIKEEEERQRKIGQHSAVFRSVTYSAAVSQESVQKFTVDMNIHRSIYVSECDWDRGAHRRICTLGAEYGLP